MSDVIWLRGMVASAPNVVPLPTVPMAPVAPLGAEAGASSRYRLLLSTPTRAPVNPPPPVPPAVVNTVTTSPRWSSRTESAMLKLLVAICLPRFFAQNCAASRAIGGTFFCGTV